MGLKRLFQFEAVFHCTLLYQLTIVLLKNPHLLIQLLSLYKKR